MKMIDLSKNKNPYLPSKEMLRFLKKELQNLTLYPESQTLISDRKFIDNIVCTNGTLEAMELITRYYHDKKIGMYNPTFWGMKYFAEKNKMKVVEITSLKYNIKEIEKIASKVNIIYICNPNNPTLEIFSRSQLLNVIKKYPNCHFVIDETMLIFGKNFNNISLINYTKEYENITVLLSLSKIYGLSGLRIGLLFTNKNFALKIKNMKVIYSNDNLSEKFLNKYFQRLFENKNFINKINESFNYFISKLDFSFIDEIKYNNYSFCLIKLKNTKSKELVSYTKKRGIILSNVSESYPELNGEWIRISAGRINDFKRLLKIFRSYEKKLKYN